MKIQDLNTAAKLAQATVTLDQTLARLGGEVDLLRKTVTEMQGKMEMTQTDSQGLSSGSEKTPKSHGLCETPDQCAQCKSVVQEIYKRGVNSVLAMPGVKEAVEYHQGMAAMGYKGESWTMVPKVLEEVRFHKLMLTPVSTPVEADKG